MWWHLYFSGQCTFGVKIMKQWNLINLENELESLKKEEKVFQWKVESTHKEKVEFYYLKGDTDVVSLDQQRNVKEWDIYVTLFVKKEDQTLGRFSGSLYPSEDLSAQIQQAINKAQVSSEKLWRYPEAKKDSHKSEIEYKTVFEPIAQNLESASLQIHENLKEAIQNTTGSEFNSAELFVSKEKKEMCFSTGLKYQTSSSKIYSEVCFSYEENGNEEEFMTTQWGCHPDQMRFSDLCESASNGARHSLETLKPASGKYHVLLHSEVLAHLFKDVMTQLNAGQKYRKLPFIEKGQELIKDFRGSPFQILQDPSIDYGFFTRKYNSEGARLSPVLLVDHNQVLANRVNHQYGQYLNWEVNSDLGNTLVKSERSYFKNELVTKAPQVLEILQFSGLFTNANDLTYSSEIRLAKLYDNEKDSVTYIKGGNLSGHFVENFKDVMFSKEMTTYNALDYHSPICYQGPEWALVTDVIVVS